MRRPKRSRRGAVDLYRVLIAVLMLGLLTLTLSWLQNRFDSADHQKATKLVRDYRATDAGPTIEGVIIAKNPGTNSGDISWTSEILSSCLGHVRVTGQLIAKNGKPAPSYAFDIDLADDRGASIHPTDPTTIDIIQALSSTVGAAHAR